MRQLLARKNKLDATDDDYRLQDEAPATVERAWHIAPLCQILACGVHVLDGTETTEDVFKETHTRRHGTLVVHMG